MALKHSFAPAVIAVAALVLTSCAVGTGNSGGGGESVIVGASKDEYIEALSGMDDVEFNVQTLGAKGSTDDAKDEAYFAAVEEWSGGKITFNINYAQSVAAGAGIDKAVSSGLLDIATVIPSYNPDVYPTFQEFNAVSGVLGDDPVASLLQAQAWWLTMPRAVPSFDEEFAQQGLKALVSGYVSAPHSMQCTKPRRTADELAGVVMRSSEPKVNELLKSVGASAANVSTAEAFEALQRGVVGCEVTSMRVSAKSGTLESAHFVTTAPIGYNAGTMVINKDVWNGLPLAAQQLFHDRLDVYYMANIASGWKASAEAADLVVRQGGSISEASPEVLEAFNAVHEKLLTKARPEVATAAVELAGGWTTKVRELGYETVAWSDFPGWYASANPMPDALVGVLSDDILRETRP